MVPSGLRDLWTAEKCRTEPPRPAVVGAARQFCSEVAAGLAVRGEVFANVAADEMRRPYHRAAYWGERARPPLDVEVGDGQGVVLDELAARFDLVAHQAGEQRVGVSRVVDLDL